MRSICDFIQFVELYLFEVSFISDFLGGSYKFFLFELVCIQFLLFVVQIVLIYILGGKYFNWLYNLVLQEIVVFMCGRCR